jgi:hypothetical protein
MISIIILSYRKAFLDKVLESIGQTVGVEYETIILDNQNSQYSICSAYNEGIKRSQYPYYCFVHEDVIFKSNNWGAELINDLKQNQNLGMIGVMGAQFKSKYATGWYNPLNNCKYLVGNIFQGKNSDSVVHFMDYSPQGPIKDTVVCLDGVFLFSKREVFEQCSFDESMLDGYHGYDLDISLQILSKGYKLMVNKSIYLFHYSTGSADVAWERYNLLISDKWHNFLPVTSIKTNGNFSLAFREFETMHIHDTRDYAIKLLFAPLRYLQSLFLVFKNNKCPINRK